MSTLSNREIAAILRSYSLETDEKSTLVEAIQSYIPILLQWNRSVSLTTITDPEQIVRFHFGESLFAASLLLIEDGRLADVGAGAGFPGLPLKMLAPSLDVTLIESNTKKAAFLAEVTRKLSIDRVHVSRNRMEKVDGTFDFITARALGRFESLLTWAEQHLAGPGRLILWLGSEDINSISQSPGWKWATPALIPGSDRRFIISGSPERAVDLGNVPRGT